MTAVVAGLECPHLQTWSVGSGDSVLCVERVSMFCERTRDAQSADPFHSAVFVSGIGHHSTFGGIQPCDGRAKCHVVKVQRLGSQSQVDTR